MRCVEICEALEQYDAMLDEYYGTVSIAGGEYRTSYALKELDPTAYDRGFADWCDYEGDNDR